MTNYSDSFPSKEKWYIIMCSLFSLLFVLSNIIGLKFFAAPFAPKVALTTGLLTYPLTFLLGDLVTELWGGRRAQFMVYIAFGLSLISIGFIQICLHLAPHPYWVSPGNAFGYNTAYDYQTAYEAIFGISLVTTISSLCAFLVAQIIDIKIFGFLKKKTEGKHLWLRNNLSTWIAQAADTVIINALVLYGSLHLQWAVVVQILITGFLYKIAIAMIETPLLYLAISWLKPRLQGREISA